jgi:8-oxo-dGTP pyrophosphatase MutT (NUDIX family)
MLEKLRLELAGYQKFCIADSNLTPSAVILPLIFAENTFHILFIKRTETVRDHKGQISFPGGHYEKTDLGLLNTALRETCEEIGIPEDRIDVLGALDDCVTISSKFVISTFIGLIPYPFDFRPDSREVAGLIIVPVPLLLDESYQRQQPELFQGFPEPVFRYEQEIIWGATARILTQFLDVWKKLEPII